MVIYNSAEKYIQSQTTLCGKIAKIDAIIEVLESTALKSAANDDINELMLDDGQTKIKTIYKGTDAVLRSIKGFEQIREMYVNRFNGRKFKLVDGSSLRGSNRRGFN